jgi:hypothetical protein
VASLGGESSYSGLSVSFAGGAPLAHAPSADGSDAWPIVAPLADLGASFMTGRTLVAGPSAGDATLMLQVGGATLALRVRRLVVTMQVSSDNASAARGMLSGVVPTASFHAAIAGEIARISAPLCTIPNAVAAVLGQMDEASDILVDGTIDPARPCDGISIGLGFEAVQVRVGDVTGNTAPPGACP